MLREATALRARSPSRAGGRCASTAAHCRPGYDTTSTFPTGVAPTGGVAPAAAGAVPPPAHTAPITAATTASATALTAAPSRTPQRRPTRRPPDRARPPPAGGRRRRGHRPGLDRPTRRGGRPPAPR